MKTDPYPLFIAWYAKPIDERNPPSLEGFCEKYKITKADIAEYSLRSEFFNDLKNESLAWAKRQTPEIIHILYNKIKKDRTSADIKAWLEMIYDLGKPNSNPQLTYNFINVPDDTYKSIIKREAKLLNISSPEKVN